MTSSDKSIRVSNCPLKLEVCYHSCFWRKGDRYLFRSQRGRRIVKIRPKKVNTTPSASGERSPLTTSCQKGVRFTSSFSGIAPRNSMQ